MTLLALMYSERNRIYQIFGGEPIKLRWGGWVSDTYLLQRDGWKFHSEEHYEPYQDYHAIRLAVTSPDTAMAISGVLRIPAMELMNTSGAMWRERVLYHGFDMQQYNAKDVFRVSYPEEISSWRGLSPVDITQPTMATDRQITMREFKVFSPSEQNTENEIYIPEESIDEMFNKILKLQYPQQQEIKKGLIMPEKKPIIQAKIFSLVA